MGSKNLAERARFRGVVRRRASAVSVDVIDLLAREPGIIECVVHGAGSPFREGIGEMMGVGRHTETGQLSINFRTARTCLLQRFEDQHGSAFAQNKAGAIFREWATRIRRDHAHPFPSL